MTNDSENQEVNQEEKQTGDYNSIISDMVDNIPDVQEHVVAAEKARNDELNNATSDAGEKFDPSIHVVGKDGKPSVTKTGKFRKKKKINNPHEQKAEQTQKDTSEQNALIESQTSATVVQDLKRSIYDGLFDYKYTDDRHKVHIDATTAYFMESGGVKLTPLQMLCVMEGFMVLEITRTEKASKKLTGLKAWLASKYVKFKGRKKNDTQSGDRANNVGKNDDSEKASR